MSTKSDAPVDLYVAAYLDPDAARNDWDAIKQLADDDVIKVEGLVLVSRRPTARSTSTTTSTPHARAPPGARSAARSSADLPAVVAGRCVGRRRRRSWESAAWCPTPRRRRSRRRSRTPCR